MTALWALFTLICWHISSVRTLWLQVTVNPAQYGLNKTKQSKEGNVLAHLTKKYRERSGFRCALNDISRTKFIFIPLGWIQSHIDFFFSCSNKMAARSCRFLGFTTSQPHNLESNRKENFFSPTVQTDIHAWLSVVWIRWAMCTICTSMAWGRQCSALSDLNHVLTWIGMELTPAKSHGKKVGEGVA